MSVSGRSQVNALLENLRFHLKARGLRQQDVADRMGVGLATVKRWLSGESLNFKRLEELCELANVELYDLISTTENSNSRKQTKFTPTQERALGNDQVLFFLFFALLHDWPVEDCMRDLSLTREEMNEALGKLERLGLLDIRSPDRVRMLTIRDVAWRENGPIAIHMKARGSFVIEPITPEMISSSAFVPLCSESVAKVRALMEENRREVERIAYSRRTSRRDRTWYGVLFYARPLDLRGIRKRADKRQAQSGE